MMHKLARQIRFSINPFLEERPDGFNSYASRPCGQGFALYFSLWVELVGPVDAETGFVVNVVEIDRQVRTMVVPIFAERIGTAFRAGKHLSLSDVVAILQETFTQLEGRFGSLPVSRLSLDLSPLRSLAFDPEERRVFYFSEKFEFAATHTLWNDKYSEEKNLAVFGKCANPAGHGHNYVVQVTVQRPMSREELDIGGFEKTVSEELISCVDHKNLNVQVPEFGRMNPTVENIARFAWEKLEGKFTYSTLSSITVWENDRTLCTYCGQ
jgi:6-pyruvoyltetrahydropterin/6-carboxytetrahydropterin synthase